MSFIESIDKNRLQKILLVTIAALVLALLVCLVVIIISGINPPVQKPGNTNFALEDHTLTDKDVSTGSLLLVDADHPYTPNEAWLDLTNIGEYMRAQSDYTAANDKDYAGMNYVPWKAMSLSKLAMPSVHAMLTAAKAEVKANPLTIDAAYKTIYHSEKSPEYNTALLIYLSDFDSTQNVRKEPSNAYRSWLDENAAKYGFIESFEDAYRYVGEVHAKYMTKEKLTLAKYIDFLKKNTDAEKAITVELDGTEYSVYYSAGKAGDTVKVPADAEYTISGTNEGGVIVTVKNAK